MHKNYTYIGKLSSIIAKKYNLNEHANKPIVIYEDRKNHIIKHHLKDFKSINKIEYIWNSLDRIINNPDEVFYNEKTNGLEYYKKIDTTILVAARISFGSTLKIRSFYPANKNKLENRKYQRAYNKYVVSEDDKKKKDDNKISI